MAILNPDVKDVKPVNPIGWSKSAEVPSTFASALSEGIKGVGNIIQTGAKAGVDIVEDFAKKATREDIEPIRDDYIAQLAAQDFKLKLGLTDSPDAPDALKSNATISEKNAADLAVPGDLKQSLRSLAILPDARANGKISETDYYGRLMSAASALRARYPVGFRDYIDKEISKITGVDPANAYIKSIIGDINATQGSQQALRNHAMTVVQSVLGLDPGTAPEMWRRVSTGEMTPAQGMAYAAPFLAIKAQHEANMGRITEQKANQDVIKTSTLQSFSKMAASTAYEQLNSTFKMAGIENAERLSDVIEDYRSGRRTMTSEQAYSYGDRAMAMERAYTTAMQKALFADPRVYGILQKEGLDVIENNAKIFRSMADDFYNKDTGAALDKKRRLEGVQSDVAHRIWTQNPNMAAILGMGKAIKEAYGDTVSAQWSQRSIAAGLDTEMDTFLQKVKSDLATPNTPGVVKEVKNLDEALQKGIAAQKVYGRNLPDYFEGVKQLVDGGKFSLLDPGTPRAMKDELGYRLWNPANAQSLRKIETDIRDPKTGELLPGQEAWFKRWTSPDVVQVVNRELRPEIRQMYHEWVKTNYEAIFGKAINDLGSMNIEGRYSVSWNDIAHPPRLEIIDAGSLIRTGVRQTPVQDVVNRVNKGIEGLANVYRGQNLASEDVSAKVLESLRFRLDEKNRATPRINDLPEKFLRILALPYEQKKAEEEAKAKKKTETDPLYKP